MSALQEPVTAARRHLEVAEQLTVLMHDVIQTSNPLICGDDQEGEQYRDMIKTYAAAISAHAQMARAHLARR